MKRIFKYILHTSVQSSFQMPADAKVLCVQMQYDCPCIWAMVDDSAPTVERTFTVYGTGHPMSEDPGQYVGTFQMHGGELIFHVFEEAVK